MSNSRLLEKDRSALIVVNMQEGFRHVIPDFSGLASKIAKMIRGCQILQIPVVVTEQYPKGLGHTAEEIASVFYDTVTIYEKTVFSSCGAEGFVAKLEERGVSQVLLCGIETHICVNQTAHELLERGFQVHLLADCIGSRFEENKRVGIEKMLQSGVIPSSIEMSLFELMRDAKHPCFKQIQALIK